MARRFCLTVSLLLLASVAGCSPYVDDFQYTPHPAMAEVRSTSPQQAPAVTSLVSVIGVRREDRQEGIPESIEIRMRIENDGSEPAAFDSRTLVMTNGQLVSFPPPIVRPPGPVTAPPMRSVNVTEFFPLPQRGPEGGDLDSLQLRWLIQIGDQKISQSVNFRRVYPRFYYYEPYWGYPYWGSPPYFWYGGVVFIHRR